MRNGRMATFDATTTTPAIDRPSFHVGTTAGTHNSRLSGQWAMRPDDQRFLDLNSLFDYTRRRYDESRSDIIDVRDVRVLANQKDPNTLRVQLPTNHGEDVIAEPNHWSFGQLCNLVQVPAGYVRKLPAAISAINMQWALANFREETIKTFVRQNGDTELAAATGPKYGRIPDHEVVAAFMRIAGNGTGDSAWKIPGVMDWGTMIYNPHAAITKQSTTLFASDRDVFMFLVDDAHPIQIGTLPNGDPDYVLRGVYGWNSEVGSKTMGVAAFYFRAICQNRILWGVEGYEEITIRHSKNAPERLSAEIAPALESFANHSTTDLLRGIKAARDAVVARTTDERGKFLEDQGFTGGQVKAIVASVLAEEGKEPESIWDFVQGITAMARDIPYQDARIAMEHRAGRMLDKVTRT